MTRPLARRLVPIAVAGACLAAAGAPALAQTTTPVDVSFTQDNPGRQFHVRNLGDDEAFSSIAFSGTDRTEAFRTVVEETDRLLGTGGYQVNARMTDLYLVDATKPKGYDFDVTVPSSSISLGYSTSQPLSATLRSLPVVPRISVSGTLKTCSDAGIASALGIAPLPLITDVVNYLTALANLTDPVVKTLCTELGDAAGTDVDLVVDGVQTTLDAALAGLPLPDLPFSLTGGEGGAFTQPSYEGPIASLHPSPGTGGTSRRVMTGTPTTLSGLTDGLAATVDAALAQALAGVGELSTSSQTGLTTVETVTTALSGVLPEVTNALASVTDTVDTAVLSSLDITLLPVDLSALTTSTATYVGYPVLKVAPTVARAGEYRGTLIVDFFDTK